MVFVTLTAVNLNQLHLQASRLKDVLLGPKVFPITEVHRTTLIHSYFYPFMHQVAHGIYMTIHHFFSIVSHFMDVLDVPWISTTEFYCV